MNTYHQGHSETIGFWPSFVSPAGEVAKMEKGGVERLLNGSDWYHGALRPVDLDGLQLQETVDPWDLGHAME